MLREAIVLGTVVREFPPSYQVGKVIIEHRSEESEGFSSWRA